jgi:hypothetical protein
MRRALIPSKFQWGFSLVEVSLVFLLVVLMLHGFLNLLTLTTDRYAHQEETVICSSEASLLGAQIRRDMEHCFVQETGSSQFDQFEKAILANGSDIEFKILSGDGAKTVKYSFDAQAMELNRTLDNQVVRMGKGRLASFSTSIRFLLNDGKDCESGDATFSVARSDSSKTLLRQWVTVNLGMKGKGKSHPSVEQEYSFQVFPFLLNKQIRSIWKN